MGVVRIRSEGKTQGQRAQLMERAKVKASRLVADSCSPVLVVYGADEAVLHFEAPSEGGKSAVPASASAREARAAQRLS